MYSSASDVVHAGGRLAPSVTTREWVIEQCFLVGDFAVLAVVGALSSWLMMRAHQVVPHFAGAVLAGMAAGMVVAHVLSSIAGLALGSIETKVYAMVVGMFAPMAICAIGMVSTQHLYAESSLALGAFVGMLVAASMMAYGAQCQERFRLGRY